MTKMGHNLTYKIGKTYNKWVAQSERAYLGLAMPMNNNTGIRE
jgi:hypothetical protein